MYKQTGLTQEARGGNSSCEPLSSLDPCTWQLLTRVLKWRVSLAQAEVILSIRKSRETSGHIQNGKLPQGPIFIFVGYYFLDKTEALVHFFFLMWFQFFPYFLLRDSHLASFLQDMPAFFHPVVIRKSTFFF